MNPHEPWDRIAHMNNARARLPASGGARQKQPKRTMPRRPWRLQYREALAQLGLSIVGAGAILGVTPRQSQRYAAGETMPLRVVLFLDLLVRHGIPAEWTAETEHTDIGETF